jgi:gas vesicle protein
VFFKNAKRSLLMKKIFGFFIGAVMGGLVGATLVLLLTPASGEQLRGQLRSRAEIIQGEIQKAANARRVELEKQLTEFRAPRRSNPVE